MFVLQKGIYCIAKMEYSYGRRAQSVTQTLHWKDVAIIDTDSIQEAVDEAIAAIREWRPRGITADIWRIEGRGSQAGQSHDLQPYEIYQQEAKQ